MITFQNAGVCGTSYSTMDVTWEPSASPTGANVPSLVITVNSKENGVSDIELNLEQIEFLNKELTRKLTEYYETNVGGHLRRGTL